MKITSPTAAAWMFASCFEAFPDQEAFFAVALTTARETIGEPWIVSVGTVNKTELHPRDVFREAIRRNAVMVIVAHNHPSGMQYPSDLDDDLTQKLVSAGDLLGIEVTDHIIIAGGRSFDGDGYYSYRSAGKISCSG